MLEWDVWTHQLKALFRCREWAFVVEGLGVTHWVNLKALKNYRLFEIE
jgi:hypothetical protein